MPALAGDHVRVLVDGYELTGDSNQLTINDTRDLYEVTTFGDSVHRFIPGRRLTNLDHAGWMNGAVARSHPVLRGAAVEGVVSVFVGENSAPTLGAAVYSTTVRQSKYQTPAEMGKAVPFMALFAGRGERGGWGTALTPPTVITSTTTGAALDNGAASANGGAAFLHIVTAAATDRYSVQIEGSATGAFAGEQTVLATFTRNAAAVGSERIALSGSIPRYVRWSATRTGSAGEPVALALSLVRF